MNIKIKKKLRILFKYAVYVIGLLEIDTSRIKHEAHDEMNVVRWTLRHPKVGHECAVLFVREQSPEYGVDKKNCRYDLQFHYNT